MSAVIVIIRMPGGPVPLHDADDNVATFESIDAAKDVALENAAVLAYGANIIDLEEDGELL